MSYIGKTPTSVPLTSSDITDGIISTDKLAANAVVTSKITDATISNADVNATLVTGQTAETSIADGDTILIHDASASALRKMTKANFVSGIGGTNTPAFFAGLSSDQTGISDNSSTKLTCNEEIYDSDNAYDNSSNYRFQPQTAGKYFVFATWKANDAPGNVNLVYIEFRKNGSTSNIGANAIDLRGNPMGDTGVTKNEIITFNGSSDYVEVFGRIDTANGNNSAVANEGTCFGAYKLIE